MSGLDEVSSKLDVEAGEASGKVEVSVHECDLHFGALPLWQPKTVVPALATPAKRQEDEMDVDGRLEPSHQHSRGGFAPANLRTAKQCNTVVADRLVV
jgi:hypothetical protein